MKEEKRIILSFQNYELISIKGLVTYHVTEPYSVCNGALLTM